MYPFSYQRARSLADAAASLADTDARPLAGGMSLVPMMRHRLVRASTLVDLAGLSDLRHIEVTPTSVAISSMTNHATVAASEAVAAAIPALAKLAGGIGDPLVRNRGTIGGSLAHNDPAACYPSALLGLGGSVETNRRTIAADDWAVGPFETALTPGEIIIRVVFPRPERASYIKFANLASRFSIVGIFLARTRDDVRVACTGAGRHVFRVSALEEALRRDFSPSAIKSIAISPEGLTEDIHGTAEYRAHLIGALTQRAVIECRSQS